MLQVVHQTREEKIKMYRKMKKKKLAEMLVNCHELLDAMRATQDLPVGKHDDVPLPNTTIRWDWQTNSSDTMRVA